MKEPPPDPQMSILLGWCLILLLALPFGAFGVLNIAGKFAANSWPKMSAEIVRSEPYRTARPQQWCIKLRYRYQAGGKMHESKRASSSFAGGAGCDRDLHVIAARLERMRPGARITVRVDPRDPADAVVYLAPVVEFIDAFFGGIAAVWLGLGIYAIRIGKQQRRDQDAARRQSSAGFAPT